MVEHLKQWVQQAAGQPPVLQAVAQLCADAERQIALRRPRCVMSGRCCRFEEYGHRLYVTTMELAAFLHELERARDSAWGEKNPGGGCPFQAGKRCTVHAFRPFGCRIFFCDSTSTQWQAEQYEHFHRRLKQLHDELHVPYAYVEWRSALAAITPGGALPGKSA